MGLSPVRVDIIVQYHDMRVRRQLTLFVEGEAAALLEAVRARFNPRQQALIACHLTLCREDELAELGELPLFDPLTLRFGRPVRFAGGTGVVLPATGNLDAFHQLRRCVLANARPHEPHITLMHPRNSTCDDDTFGALCTMSLPDEITFRRASLIEQVGDAPWSVLPEPRC
jgi:hypothetical protein